MARNYLLRKILTRGTRISVLKNELTTTNSLKVDLKFSTLAPSIVKFQVAQNLTKIHSKDSLRQEKHEYRFLKTIRLREDRLKSI